MTKVLLNGWVKGLKKIPLDLLIKERAALRLSVAKNKVDRLLAGEVVILDFPDAEEAQRFLEEAIALGARGEIKDD